MKKSQRKMARFQINIWNETRKHLRTQGRKLVRRQTIPICFSYVRLVIGWTRKVAYQKEIKEEKFVKAESQISTTGLISTNFARVMDNREGVERKDRILR